MTELGSKQLHEKLIPLKDRAVFKIAYHSIGRSMGNGSNSKNLFFNENAVFAGFNLEEKRGLKEWIDEIGEDFSVRRQEWDPEDYEERNEFAAAYSYLVFRLICWKWGAKNVQFADFDILDTKTVMEIVECLLKTERVIIKDAHKRMEFLGKIDLFVETLSQSYWLGHRALNVFSASEFWSCFRFVPISSRADFSQSPMDVVEMFWTDHKWDLKALMLALPSR